MKRTTNRPTFWQRGKKLDIKDIKDMKKTIFAVMAALFLQIGSSVFAQQPFDSAVGLQQEIYAKNTFVSSLGDTLLYRSLAPLNQKTGKKYPLVLFMHGAGERGNDNEKQLTHGAQLFLNPYNRDRYPAFVIFPQCPENAFWSYSQTPRYQDGVMPSQLRETPEITAVMELLRKYVASGQVDTKRIYVMGLSMGGMATFDLAVRYPDFFAAAVPICGAVDVSRFTQKPSIKFRIFHGDSDPTVPVACSRAAYRRLTELGAKAAYTEFPGVGHNSWNPAFSTPYFLSWLFRQHR